MATKNSGLPPELPKAPGNAKAGQPPRRAEAGGELPRWLDPASAAWPKARVGQIDAGLRSRAGTFTVGDPQLRDIPGFRVFR